MAITPRRSLTAASLVSIIGASFLPASPAARAQTAAQCSDPSPTTPEVFGPTDISATTGNQRLSVALNPEGTVTVMRWPSPSYYDQIKYRTTERNAPRKGALPNEGALLGFAWLGADPPGDDPPPWHFSWLREWASSQRFADDDGDEIVTTYRRRGIGITVEVRDVVAADRDALIRAVTVRRTRSSPVRRVRIISFANFNPVVSKESQGSFQDWCVEAENDDGAEYRSPLDAIVASRSGIDESTGRTRSVFLMMGFAQKSHGHHVGPDSFETALDGSAYTDSQDAQLSSGDSASGQVDAAMSDALDLRTSRVRRSTAIITAGPTSEVAAKALRAFRRRTPASVRSAKAKWWLEWLGEAPLPRRAPQSVSDLAKRSLIVVRQALDPRGHSVGSIATQPPQNVDTPREGAFVNRLLNVAGHGELAARHNRRYVATQATTSDPRPPTPTGNWPEAMYADGTRAGPVPYEIDATGFALWTLWDHYLQTRNQSYLFDVWPSIRAGALYLTDVCVEPTGGLPCPAATEGNATPNQNLRGAQAAWLGLNSATAAATNIFGSDSATATKFRQRRNQLRDAIENAFYDAGCKCYTSNLSARETAQVGGTLLWPVVLADHGSAQANSQAAHNWRWIRRVMRGDATSGGLEIRAVLGNAFAWARYPKKARAVRDALTWIARVPTTSSGLLGEAWMRYPKTSSPIATMVAQPDIWSHAMYYIAAIKAYGRAPYSTR